MFGHFSTLCNKGLRMIFNASFSKLNITLRHYQLKYLKKLDAMLEKHAPSEKDTLLQTKYLSETKE